MIMTSQNISTIRDEMFFVTLKASRDIYENEFLADIFEKREYSDVFVKTLIYLIEKCQLSLYGFVILSDQIHLIVSSPYDDILEKTEKLKRMSAGEILKLISRKLNDMDDHKSRQQVELRKIFGDFINSGSSVFWGKNEKFLPLKRPIDQNDIHTISSEVLLGHLADDQRNYLQLGANAFTKLMMEAL